MIKFGLISTTSIILLLLLIPFESKASDSLFKVVNDTTDNVLVSDYFDLKIRYSSHNNMDDSPTASEGMVKFDDWLSENFFVPKSVLKKLELRPIRILFMVNRGGELSGFKVLEDAGVGTGKVMIELLKKSANLLPVRNNKRINNIEFEISVILISKGNSFSSIKGIKGNSKEEYSESVVKPAYNYSEPDISIYDSVEINPEPSGGMASFRKWFSDNYQYPQSAIDNRVEGTIEVSFVVEKDGSLTNIKLLKDLSHGTGQAAIHLIKRARRWTPGINNGRPVRVAYKMPLTINLSEM